MAEEITREQLSRVLFDTLRAKTILANQNALAYNEVLRQTPVYKADIKKHGLPYTLALIRYEKKEFDKVEHASETLPDFKGKDVVTEAFEKSNKAIQLLAKMAFVDYDQLEETLYALALDPKSMSGLAKKINKNSKRVK